MSPDLEEPLAFLNRYYQAFSTLNVDAILPFFNEPTMFVSAHGVNPVPTRAALGAIVFTPMLQDLTSRGYHRSEFSLQQGARISDAVAVLIGVAVRYKADATELERVTLSYTLRKDNNDWRIAVLAN